MRDSRKKLAKHSRQRRAALAFILLASPPALADELENNPVPKLPPLPLKPKVDAPNAQTNPFCEPFVNLESLKFLLASGNEPSSMKLKPIGAAIGLQSINDKDAAKHSSAKMTIEPVPTASIQTNPMAGSMHRHNDELVDAEVDDRAVIPHPFNTASWQRADANPAERKSSIVLMPRVSNVSAPIKTASPNPEGKAIDQSSPSNNLPANNEAPLNAETDKPRLILRRRQIAPIVVPPSSDLSAAVAQRTPTQESLVAEAVPVPVIDSAIQEEDSIQFSLSDRNNSLKASQGVDAFPDVKQVDEPTSDVKVSAPNDKLAETEQTAEIDYPNVVEESEVARIGIQLVKPISISDPRSMENDDAHPESGLKTMSAELTDDSGAAIAVYGSGRSASKLDHSSEDSLHTKRYRPPVAVKQVPIAVVREASEKTALIAEPMVMPIDAPILDDPQPTLSSKLTPLYMIREQVRSLTLGGEVRRVEVVNESICQALAAGPNQLKLIGTGSGVTKLVVWADGDDENAPPRMRSFEIHVKDSVQTPVDAIEQKMRLLNQSISRAFPDANVVVRRDGDQLNVAGNCESETTAKMIMRMVRKTCTVPVKDELMIR